LPVGVGADLLRPRLVGAGLGVRGAVTELPGEVGAPAPQGAVGGHGAGVPGPVRAGAARRDPAPGAVGVDPHGRGPPRGGAVTELTGRILAPAPGRAVRP